MKSAKEMFEELGYTCEKSIGEIAYVYHIANQRTYSRRINFYLSLKEYSATEALSGLFIDVKLNKAIQKQMEELGWLDE